MTVGGPPAPFGGEFLLYQTEDGQIRVECRFADSVVNYWLTTAADGKRCLLPGTEGPKP